MFDCYQAKARLLRWLFSVIGLTCAFLISCGGGGGIDGSQAPIAPHFVESPASIVLLAGQTATFNSSAKGTPAPTFQWYRNGVAIAGATAATLTYGPVSLADDHSLFFVQAFNSVGSVESNQATLTVHAPPTILTQPTDSYADADTPVTFSVSVSGSTPLSYQWKMDGNNLPGATSSALSLTFYPWLAGSHYSVTITNPYGVIESQPAALNFSQNPAIAVHPSDLHVLSGQSATFQVTPAATGPWTFQWYRNGTLIPGAVQNSFSLPAVAASDDSALFSAIVVGPHGSSLSRSALLRVDASAQVPDFIEAPTDLTVPEGADAVFRAISTGTGPIALTWRRNGLVLPGAAECRLRAVTASDDGAVLTVEATNMAGSAMRSAKLHVITKAATPPLVDLIAPQHVSPGQRNVPVAAPSLAGLTCEWTVLNGTASAIITAQGSHASLDIGPSDGTFTLQVTVSNSIGDSATATRVVSVGVHGQWTRPYPEEPSLATQGVSVLLPSGFVLLVARANDSWPIFSRPSQICDPVTGLWGPVAATTVPRFAFTATVLKDGRVLVVGGDVGNTAEIYDPASGTWKPTATAGPVTARRNGHGACLLEDGTVLIFGGTDQIPGGNQGTPNNLCLRFDPVTETWNPTGSMGVSRSQPASVRLPGGRILVTGGTGMSSFPVADCEIYDPVSGTWNPTGSFLVPRRDHTLVVLPDGWVLASGGMSALWSNSHLASCEVRNPATGQWQATGSLIESVIGHSSTLLRNGKVLNVGGETNTYANTFLTDYAETYDPSTGRWSFDSLMTAPLRLPTLLPLPDGRLFQVGGLSNNYNESSRYEQPWLNAQVFDPEASRWTPVTPLLRECSASDTAVLADGRIFVAGGSAFLDFQLTRCALVDPFTGNWTPLEPLKTFRYDHRVIQLLDGRTAVFGGAQEIGWVTVPLDSVEIFDPHSGRWTDAASMNVPRYGHSCTLLADGRVLVAGGDWGGVGGGAGTAEIFDPVAGTWTPTGPMVLGPINHTATLLPDGRVLVAGGGSNYGLSAAEIFDPITLTWRAVPAMSTYRAGHTATLVSGKVLVVGGHSPQPLYPSPSTEWFDPKSESWSPGPAPAIDRMFHTATLLQDGRLLITSGRETSGNNPEPSCEILDPATSTWSPTGQLPFGRTGARVFALPGGSVVILGGEIPMLQLSTLTP